MCGLRMWYDVVVIEVNIVDILNSCDVLYQEFRARMLHIIRTINDLQPCVACLQEVTPCLIELLHDDDDIRRRYDLSTDNVECMNKEFGYCVLTLTKKELRCKFKVVQLPTTMGRELVIAHPQNSAGLGSVAVGNVHLESLDNHSLREKQLTICYEALETYDTSLLVGDFNFCSLKNFHPNRGLLENNSLETCLSGFDDVWLKLHGMEALGKEGAGNISPIDTKSSFGTPPRINLMESRPCDTAKMEVIGTPEFNVNHKVDKAAGELKEGFTYDSKWNGLLGNKDERMRYDRIMLRSGDWIANSMSLLGTEPIDANILLQRGRHIVRGLWPSDHFGLECTLVRNVTGSD